MYQTFPRTASIDAKGAIKLNVQFIDIGKLGPDVDTLVAVDFPGKIVSNVPPVFTPEDGKVQETRVVFIRRASLETVQLGACLGGDRFDMYQVSKFGGDSVLDGIARLHAANTARKHQTVLYIGDLAAFEDQYGSGEKTLLNTLIRAQRPDRQSLGINLPDFVNDRAY